MTFQFESPWACSNFGSRRTPTLYNWRSLRVPMKMKDLPEEMRRFGRWVSIGLASRSGMRGYHQKNVMAGTWSGWAFPTAEGQGGLKLRKTDFTFRVSLLIHGFHRVGLTIEEASARVGEYPFVRRQLGSRKRSHSVQEEVGFGPTLRTGYYYPFLRKYAHLDHVFELWWGIYLNWKEWIVLADQQTIRFVATRYQDQGQDEGAKEFLSLVKDIQEKTKPASQEQQEEGFRFQEQALLRSLHRMNETLPAPDDNATQSLAENPQTRPDVEIGTVAMTTANLAILYHCHHRWDSATARYQEAYDLYGSSRVPQRVGDLVLPWLRAQIERCGAQEPPEPRPVLRSSSHAAGGRPRS